MFFFSKPFSKLGRRGKEAEEGGTALFFFFFDNDLLLPIEKTVPQRLLGTDNSNVFAFRNFRISDRSVKDNTYLCITVLKNYSSEELSILFLRN